MDPRDLPDITDQPKKYKRNIRSWFASLNEDPTLQDEISSLAQRHDDATINTLATEPPFIDDHDPSLLKSVPNYPYQVLNSTPALQRNDALLTRRTNKNPGPGHHRHKTAVLENSAADKYLGTAATASSVRENLPPCIIHPLHPWYRVWWNVTVVVAAITSILEPFTIAFTPPGLYPYGSATSILEYICIILIAIDMGISFNVAVYRNGVLLTDRKSLAKKYLKPIFIIDLISIIPFDEIALAIAGLNGAKSAQDPILAQYFSLFKLLRMLRGYRMLWFFSFLTFNLAAPLLLVTLLRNIYFTFFLANFAACSFYFEARQAGFSEFTWVGSNPFLFEDASTSAMYIYSLYWSFATLSTTGYGDIVANNPVEAGLIAFWMLFLIFFTAYIIGSITLLVVKNDERVGSYREQMRSLQKYSALHALPLTLRESMQRHLKLHFYNADAADEHVLKFYPLSIRRKVLRQLYNPTLRECYLFQGARSRFIDALLSVARVELYLPQVDILSSGDYVNELFIVAAGRLTCVCPQQQHPANNTTVGAQEQADIGDTTEDSVIVNLDEDREARLGSYISFENFSYDDGGSHNCRHSDTNSHHRTSRIHFIEEGNSFGELAFFTASSQLETIRTQTTCRILVISRAAFDQIAVSFPESKKQMLLHLARKEEDATLELFPGPEGVHMFNTSMAEKYKEDGGDRINDGTAAATTLPGDTNGAAEDPTLNLNSRKKDEEIRLSVQQRLALGSLRKLKGIVAQAVLEHDADRLTLWMYAAARGDVGKIREMVFDHGCDPNMYDYDGRTALMLASSRGFRDVVSVLLSAGADPNTEDTFGGTALLEACKHGHDDIIDVLITSGAKLGVSLTAHQEKIANLLCSTVHNGDLKLLRRLLQAGADGDAVNYDGRTALHIAAAEGNVPAVELLVAEGGADVRKRDRWGATAEEEARRVGARGCEMFLVAEAEALLEKK